MPQDMYLLKRHDFSPIWRRIKTWFHRELVWDGCFKPNVHDQILWRICCWYFFLIFMLLWMSRYLHKSENKTWIPKNKLSVLTLITLNNIWKGNGRFVGKTLWKYLFKSQMIGTLLLRIINILIGILKSNYLCSTNVHVGSFHQFAN